MAKQGRSGLNGLVGSNVPDNNAKLITPTKHREVLTDYSDSKFNLIDDNAVDVNFDNTGTDLISDDVNAAIIELNSRVRPFLGGGTIRIGDIAGAPGDVKNILDGTFTSCTIDSAVLNGLIYQVNMPDVGTSDYFVNIEIVSISQLQEGQRTFRAVIGNSTTPTGFKFSLGEFPGTIQDVNVEIILIKKF